jgi:hypothetical protein
MRITSIEHLTRYRVFVFMICAVMKRNVTDGVLTVADLEGVATNELLLLYSNQNASTKTNPKEVNFFVLIP